MKRVLKDETGNRYGRLLVIYRVANDNRSKQAKWFCRCDCGKETSVSGVSLRNGNSKSCGCGRYPSVHGWSKTRFYNNWAQMISRCHNPKDYQFARYGAKGIAVCDRWRGSFINFLNDMGPPPLGMSLDRIDNSKGYEPGNVRWASKAVQTQNRTITKLNPSSVHGVRVMGALGFSETTIAMHFGVSRAPVGRILRGEAWTNVP